MGPRRSALLVLAVLCRARALLRRAGARACSPPATAGTGSCRSHRGSVLNSVAMPDARDAWAVGNGGVIMHSTDGGANWTVQASPTTDPLAGITFSDAQHGCAVGGDWAGTPPCTRRSRSATSVIVYYE